MENLIIYLVIALFAIVSGIKNYKKEKAKSKERSKEIFSQPIPSIKPFQKKENQNNHPTPPLVSTEYAKKEIVSEEDNLNDINHQLSLDNVYNSNDNKHIKNIYDNKDIDSILTRIEEYSDINEKAAFFVESDKNIYQNDQIEKSSNLELNSPEDYRRAFIHSLIFERKY